MTIYFATKVRGFFKHLFSLQDINYQFVYSKNQIYETNSLIRRILAEIVHIPLMDWLGVIQIINCKNKGCDIYGSFNRFLNADKPYFIYVENPTGLYHYSLNRKNSFWGKININKKLNNKKLKALIFMSKASADTFEDVCGKIPAQVIRKVIYPYVPGNDNISIETIRIKSRLNELRLLFIAQGIPFFAKGALEVIEVFKKIRHSGYNNITLTMITTIDEIEKSVVEEIKRIEGITLFDFKFNYNEIEKIYAKSSILLQPTSQDSFGLTILEAMKAGMPIISTKLYSIPEVVQDGVNGFLTEPHYWYFDRKNIPNPEIWNHTKETIYSKHKSDKIVDFLYNSILLLNNDRSLLEKMSIKSFEIANSPPFDKNTIVSQWNDILNRMLNS